MTQIFTLWNHVSLPSTELDGKVISSESWIKYLEVGKYKQKPVH